MLWERGTSANSNEVVMKSSLCAQRHHYTIGETLNKVFHYSKMHPNNILRDISLGELLKYLIRMAEV